MRLDRRALMHFRGRAWLIVTVAVLGFTAIAGAQDRVLGQTASAEQLLANRLAQEALYCLERIQGEPREDQLACAAILMDMALELNDKDAELWRSRKELAQIMDDSRAMERAVKAYIALRPSDDAAQLELILARLDRLNTLDERLSLLERILASGSASSLSNALRSRLESYAAISARELGDETKFIDHLKQAVRLDPANETAATLVYEHVREVGGSAVQVGAVNVSMIKASPLSSTARLSFATTLAREAACERAARQFQLAASLSFEPMPSESISGWFFSLVGSGQPQQAADLLEQWRAMKHRQTVGPAPEGQTQEMAPLPLDLSVLRLSVLEGEDLATSYRWVRDQILAEAEKQQGEQAGQMKRQLAWVAAVFGQDLDQVEAYLADTQPTSVASVRARGWLHIQRSELDAARQVLNSAAEDPICQLGLAVMAGVDDAGRARAMLELIHTHPTSLAATIAAKRIIDMGREVLPTPTGRSLIELMDRQPNALWRMDLQRNAWMTLRMEVAPRRFAFREPITATLTLRNNSLLPLSLGPQRTVPSTTLISISPSVSGIAAPPVPPTIADLGRKLTLAPGEEVVIDVRLDRGGLGRFLDHFMYQTIAFSTEAILDPRTAPNGAVRPGPFGASHKVQVNQAWALPATEANVETWLTQLNSADTLEQFQALGRLANLNNAEKPGIATDATLIQNVAAQLGERFKTMGTLEQAWVVLWLAPDQAQANPMHAIHEMARRSDDPVTRIAYLLSVISDAQDPMLAAAMRHENRRIREFAANYKVLLTKHAEEQRAAEQAAAAQQQQEPQPQPAP